MGLILDCLEMNAVKREGLNAAVSAVGDHQQWLLSARIDPLPVGIVEFRICMSRPGNFAEKRSLHREAQHMIRTVAIPNVEIAVGCKRNVCRHEVDWMLGIVRIFFGISVHPDFFAAQGSLHDPAAVDVAVVKELFFFLPGAISVRVRLHETLRRKRE